MGADTGRDQSYQWMLRAVGAILDEEPSCRIALAEVPDGFLVRMQRTVHRLEPKMAHFSRVELTKRLADLAQERGRPLELIHHPGIWSKVPGGHQEFFRSLGFELDEASAHGIVVEELEDGIVVTYSYPEADTGAWRKRMVVLRLSEIEEVLNAAFERRNKGP